jgi:hypothetical protein
MTDSTRLQPLSSLLTQLRTQSTIYRCHETRLARSLALKDDPRAPVIRVLSLLPGFSLFVRKYDPMGIPGESSNKMPSIGDYSEETVFNNNDESETSASTARSLGQKQSLTGSAHSCHFTTIMITTATAAVAHAALWPLQIPVFNPFQSVTTRRVVSASTNAPRPTFAQSSSAAIALQHALVLMTRPATKPQRLSTLITHVPVVSASVGLLFGTRDILDPQHGSLFASAAAGLVASFPALLCEPQPRLFASTALPLHLVRHAMGGTAYFGVYEYTRGHDSMWQTVVAGSMAGVAGAAVTAPRTIWRAAPTHAIVWCVYEQFVGSRSWSRSSVRP